MTNRIAWATSFLAGLSLMGGCITLPLGSGDLLQDQIESVISTPPLDQVSWGIRIIDPERGQVLYSRNAHKKFVPASNMKLLSTATAVSLLGPEYRYETTLWGVGPLDETGQVLRGDLVLRASGDPTLSERFYPSAEAPLDSLAQDLWAKGLRTVTGSLVVDVSRWDSTTVPGSWMVANLPGTSSATGGAFSIAEGILTVEITAGDREGDPGRARWWPFLDEGLVSVSYTTVHADSSQRGRRAGYLPESRRLQLEGPIRAGGVDTIRVNQRDPVRLASSALLMALERRGIQIQGGLRLAWDPGEVLGSSRCVTGDPPPEKVESETALPHCPDATLMADLTSPPMAEIVKAILEPSQNWMTEQLVRTLGAERGERGSWREGFRVEQEFLVGEVGVDSMDVTYRDGSGLSAQNLVTPRALVRILEFMRSSDHSGLFRGALASPREDGTLRNRLPELESRVFAKTGTLTHVTSLSGYVFTDSGRELIFSILTNGSGLSSAPVQAAIDEIVLAAAGH